MNNISLLQIKNSFKFYGVEETVKGVAMHRGSNSTFGHLLIISLYKDNVHMNEMSSKSTRIVICQAKYDLMLKP